ncbi:glycogen synthase [Candidatus Falkowbacteria bacterium]|nr:glycogen synthase [Candidatus Falkowbacteria bacterium]
MKNNNLKILIAAAEIAPIAKVGGLGDVAGALPKALVKLKLDARLIAPFYGVIDRNKYKIKLIKQNIKTGHALINLWQTVLPDSTVPIYLIEHNFFKNKKIYSLGAGGEPKDTERFSFFSLAILESMKAINFLPDVVHLNDWHTAATAALLKNDYKDDRFFKQTKTLYTIHNLANQGLTDSKNYMAEGILNADLINTVSPTYAKEILTKEYGAGLENILAKRRKQLYGILNGIDIDFFNPTNDKLIKFNYSAETLEKKLANKTALQCQLGLFKNEKTALVGLITRFVRQKGIELITEKFSKLNCQFVFLGTGEEYYEKALLNLAGKYPNKFKVLIKFDEKLAHKIYAASDIFLALSLFEPCGLTQMIAMRYGSVPIARLTGGLADTVNNRVGFTFKNFGSLKFYKALKLALKIYYEKPKAWQKLRLNGIKQNFSWDKSAKEYLELYKKLKNLKK